MSSTPSGTESGRLIGPAADGVVAREVGDCFAVLSPDTSQAMVLNATASDVWRLAGGDLTLERIVDLLARAYKVSPETIRVEVERTVASLEDYGLLLRPDG